jgi:uncharacterized membrane protein YkvA (DUF1232 family)
MTPIERLHHEAIFFKNHKPFMTEIKIYQAVLKDPRCPRPARWLLAVAIAYTLSPIDLIPDFIPVIGHLDDILIVPLLLFIAIRLMPRELIEQHRVSFTKAKPINFVS